MADNSLSAIFICTMSANVINTIAEMKELAKTHRRVLVGFSGGKDSLCILDLACRFFPEVVPFYMELVPGLEFDNRRLQIAKDRYGLEVLRFPHFIFWEYLKGGVYCDFIEAFENLPDIKAWDYYRWVIHETNSTLMLDGMKKSDGTFRRRKLANESEEEKRMRYRPLKKWLKWEVLNYLKAQDIPLPKQEDSTSAGNAGVSLQVQEVLWMHDNYPADYEKIRAAFPYIDAIVARRDFFGLTDG